MSFLLKTPVYMYVRVGVCVPSSGGHSDGEASVKDSAVIIINEINQ